MTSAPIRSSSQVRKDFLDFFKSKPRDHTIVRSSPLDYRSRDGARIFTNAGMNQFVPIFLGEEKPAVNKWADCIPGLPTRAADTQKCIRATGKHNDLEDVGLDTYHHTFFEMLGNWSFGDYFKKESLEWGWELLTKVWGFPAKRLYVTVYRPGPGEPSELDQEAYDVWAGILRREGLDPKTHIVFGGQADNFWMMGDTGPCGPCSEIHMDLTQVGDTCGMLVNKGSAECIEIWNHVFIQYNANADGTFSPLPARHVDTGMGFERVTAIIQGTKGFKNFTHARISNYETDIFRPIFDELEKLSGREYKSTLPIPGTTGETDQEKIDIAFRVIADHIRTLGFAVADGIQPSNEGRGYVLRRILRRAVRNGRTLGFHEPFFFKLVDVLAGTMGGVFPEIRARQKQVQEVIRSEEEAFNRTLDRGIELFTEEARRVCTNVVQLPVPKESPISEITDFGSKRVSGEFAFKLYDTYGFPFDLTELMARERGLTVDKEAFEKLMDEQKARARAAQKKTVVTVQEDVDLGAATEFVGYERTKISSRVLQTIPQEKRWAIILAKSPFYAEMGGQVGDTGSISAGARLWPVVDTKKVHSTWLHLVETDEPPAVGAEVELEVDAARRNAIQRHHTVTHLLHWALHEVVSRDASQKGSSVGPDKLTFDFNSAPLTAQQVADVEKLVNERILENAAVTWTEAPYAEVKSRKDVMQFFGEKYGDVVRVVQIGGRAGELNGYSMELCGGTHTRATGEIGLFRIVGENAIAAGIRRIEAIAGLEAYRKAADELQLIKTLSGKVNSPVHELENKIESLVEQQKAMEKQLRVAQQREASNAASLLLEEIKTVNGIPAIIHNLGAVDGDFLQSVADSLKERFKGVIVLGGGAQRGNVALVAAVTPDFISRVQAGKIIQQIAPIVGGKGGGKPDNARGGGKDASKLDEALAKAKALLEN